MRGLLALAVGVELFGEVADSVGGIFSIGFGLARGAVRVTEGDADWPAKFVIGVEVWKGEGPQALRLQIDRIIADAQSRTFG